MTDDRIITITLFLAGFVFGMIGYRRRWWC